MATGFRFQDRDTQRLKDISDALSAIDEAIEEIKADTRAGADGLDAATEPYSANVKRLLDRFTKSEVRDRFATRLSGGGPVAKSSRSPMRPRPDRSNCSEEAGHAN
jgi:hypothetical protein